MRLYYIPLILFMICINSCNGQIKDIPNTELENSKMREKFDFIEYDKRNSATHIIYKNDSTIKMFFLNNKLGVYRIYPNKSSFKTIYKEFYVDGYIKKKITYIGEHTKVGISEYYDKDGNVEKVNEDEKFGKIKPEDVLKFLEEKEIINLSTGDGRFDEDGWTTFEIDFEENTKIYTITIKKGKPNTDWGNRGEPRAFLPIYYKMDGETGAVKEIE